MHSSNDDSQAHKRIDKIQYSEPVLTSNSLLALRRSVASYDDNFD